MWRRCGFHIYSTSLPSATKRVQWYVEQNVGYIGGIRPPVYIPHAEILAWKTLATELHLYYTGPMKLDITVPGTTISPWALTLLLSMFVYLFLVHSLRHQRAKILERKYAPAGRESFRDMTADDAQAILKTLAELEFPILYGFAMLMSLFRVSSAQHYFCYWLLADLYV